MDYVKAFNSELSSLYEVKPPISKAKMTSITRGAIKAIKFYKHVVQSVEKFILKCKPEYKVPGLYVIDSIVRQSRHQFGADKDVFAPRFAKNIQQTFVNLFKCPPEDKSKIIRVLNLWQKNQVFAPEVVQPLFDLADPNNPIHKEMEAAAAAAAAAAPQSNGLNAATALVKGSPALQKTPTKNAQANDAPHGGANLNLSDPNILVQLQQLQRLIQQRDNKAEGQVHFDRKLLDFDYGDEEEEVNPSPKPAPTQNDSVASLLTNPEVLRQLQTLQQAIPIAMQQNELDPDKMRKLQEMKQQEDEFDKHLAQTVPNLPFAAECEFKPGTNNNVLAQSGYFQNNDMQTSNYDLTQDEGNFERNDSGNDVEVITLDQGDSRSPSPRDDRHRRRRSRSRSRDRDRRDRDRRRRSNSRSRSRRHRSRSRDRDKDRKEKEKETEKDKERKKRGLPAIKKDNLSVCSTTLWVGHLSKLVHQDDLSNTFGEFGDIVSIDLIPPRGCAFIVMHRRQDAARCLTKLKNHVIHGKAITLAWAPGKGVKGKDLKDYWEGDLGVSYIPWAKLKPDIDIEMLEDGGMIDEDTMPPWMKAKMATLTNRSNAENTIKTLLMTEGASLAPQVDTSQPPPMPGAGLLQTPLSLPLVSPFQFNNRLLAPPGPGMMNLPPAMVPNVNVPLGVPPPNLQTTMLPNQLLGIGSPFQGPPGLLPPTPMSMPGSDSNSGNPESTMKNLADSLLNLTQPFGMMPQPPHMSALPHDDNMDVEMELEEKVDRFHREEVDQAKNDRRDRKDDRDRGRDRERDRRRDSRDRDRDRDRDSKRRDRDRRNSRDRDRSRSRDRKTNRDRDRRDRPNRWGDAEQGKRDAPPEDRRERERALNERLQEMANYTQRDRSPRERTNSGASIPPPVDNFNQVPPQDDFPPRNIVGPPLEFEPPPQLDENFPPPFQNFDQQEERFPPRGGRGEYRDEYDYDPRMRGPPQADFYGPPPQRDNFGPRDGFGPRGPRMRGGPDFAPRQMRPPGPHKFHPRGGPHMRGHRQGGPWNFGPRFDGPPGPRFDGPPGPRFDGPGPIFDGPPGPRFDGPPGRFDGPPGRFDGPPGRFDGPPIFDGPTMFDGPPHFDGPPRFDGPPGTDFYRGPPGMYEDRPRHSRRFDDRRRGRDYGPDGGDRRSRWGKDEGASGEVDETSGGGEVPPPGSEAEVGGGNTPLHDEPGQDIQEQTSQVEVSCEAENITENEVGDENVKESTPNQE